MVVKRIYSKLRHWYNRKWLHKTEMDIKIEEMRRRGYKIGERCHLYSPLGTAEPYLVEIKDNVTISYGGKVTRNMGRTVEYKQQIENDKTYHVCPLWQGAISRKAYIVKWIIRAIAEEPKSPGIII